MSEKYLSKWEPFRDLVNMRTDLDRLFGSFFGKEMMMPESMWHPVIDIAEHDGVIEVKAEVPGMQKEDIKVSVRDNMLQISGERKQENEKKDRTYHVLERSYGKFVRTIDLPAPVDADKIKANYKDGVLTIVLQKPESLKPKNIEVNIN